MAVFLGLGLMFLLVAYAMVIYLSRPPDQGDALRYDEFFNDLRAGRIQGATVLTADRRIVGAYDAGRYWIDYGGEMTLQTTLGALQQSRVPVVIDNQWGKQLIGPLTVLMPSLILVDALLLTIVLMRGGGGAFGSFGRMTARRVARDETRITFKEVAGLDEAVEELAEVKDYLSNPAKFLAMGARVPKGILLIGPPGCGKTLLARALAGETGVPFFSISGSDFVEIFVGVGAARIRDLFREAYRAAPSIVFIDELDAVGRGRTASAVGGQDEREATLNQLLVGLDGFDSEAGVIVLAATNRPDVLDSALLRPGRFDRRITIDRPDVASRFGILRVHARGKPLAPDVDLMAVAKRTAGFVGSDLASVVNEAALLAARRGRTEISQSLMREAVERVIAGPERHSRVLEPEDKRRIAYHEAGHAVVATLLDSGARVSKISLVGRAGAGGFTWFTSDDERLLSTERQLYARLASLLGGRAAEDVVFNEASSAGSDDLERASVLARRIVCELGLSPAVGAVSLKLSAAKLEADGGVPIPWSNELSALADREMRRLVAEGLATAKGLLEREREALERIAEGLIEVETLEGTDLEEALRLGPRLAAPALPPA